MPVAVPVRLLYYFCEFSGSVCLKSGVFTSIACSYILYMYIVDRLNVGFHYNVLLLANRFHELFSFKSYTKYTINGSIYAVSNALQRATG